MEFNGCERAKSGKEMLRRRAHFAFWLKLNLNQLDARERTCYRLYLRLNKYLRRIRTCLNSMYKCLRIHQNRPTFPSFFYSPFRIQNSESARIALSIHKHSCPITWSICRMFKFSNQHVSVRACRQRPRSVAHKCFALKSHAKENHVHYTKPKMISKTYLACSNWYKQRH